jgi:membrane associated rhomboid family serine protease
MLSQNANKTKSSMMHDLIAYLFINCSWTWCSHMMMHEGQTHIRRNCFSIGIISSKLQSGCYIAERELGSHLVPN